MKRLFQHYEGEVKPLKSLNLSSLYCFYDEVHTTHVVFIWLGINDNASWLRIFIDDIYCGIDAYQKIEFEDDDLLLTNYDDWVKGLTIQSADVTTPHPNEPFYIKLTIKLSNKKQLILKSCSSDERCSLSLS